MPKHRPPREIWAELRKKVWQRDGGRCQGPYCQDAPPLPLNKCQIDHIQSGPLANNSLNNLRALCRRCHALRLDQRHRGLIASALRDGIIPPDWRRFTWDNDNWPNDGTVQAMQRWLATQNQPHE
ncbi:MAG: HNH endonuclease [Anaerolineales bacterium]|nr:HNH endonuclease [Anaerolineales bacterium]